MQENKLALFEEKEIRREWHNEEWYFSIEDVVQILTDSVDVKQYIKKLKVRDEELNNNWGTICTLVEMTAKDGRRRKIRTANTKGILRIIQSIPSPKAEPFKLWLAQVGSERLEEIVNPELAINRAKETYIRKGYEDTWIAQRLKSIDSRKELTDTWKERGAKHRDYAILTDEIYKSTFNMNTAQYKELKGIGTYAIVIMQEQKIVKTIAKKCNVQLENSTECEVFAIFQAIKFIEGSLLKKKIIQKFWLKTDCAVAKDFFIKRSKIKIFKKNLDLLDTINKSFERITKTLSKKDCSFRLKWIPRGANKIAHKHSCSVFKRLKVVNEKNEILVIDKRSFIEILSKFNKKQCEIIIYLFKISNEQKLILRTQKEIAEEVNISVVSINKVFQILINLNVLEKVKNGKYALLI